MKITDWKIEGSGGEVIYGTTHDAQSELKGVILMAHGFKGYKDYGMFPWLATRLSAEGFIVHRFNFSHSGMVDGDGPFEREDLFEQATWNTQVEDLQILSEAFTQENMPLILFGHSRGGVATLLAVGRGTVPADGVIALSSPSGCNPFSREDQDRLLDDGRLESPSGRTGQMLYVGKVFLEEQLESPEMHDLQTLLSQTDVPCLLIHGEDDSTVLAESAHRIAENISNSTVAIITGGDHVFNTQNPFPIDGEPSQQLQDVWEAIQVWLECSFGSESVPK